MFSSKTLLITATLLIVVAMTTLPVRVTADRSFYAPGPVNYPGLLPRFGGGNDYATQTSGVQRGGSDSRRQGPADDDSLVTRFGERDDDYNRNQRVRPSSSTSNGCQQTRVPCYDCIVYISRTGEITRYNPVRRNDLY